MEPIEILGRLAELFFRGTSQLPSETELRTKARNVATDTLKGTRQIVMLLAITALSLIVSSFGVWFTATTLLAQYSETQTFAFTGGLAVSLVVLAIGLAGFTYGLSNRQWQKIVQQDLEEERARLARLEDERRIAMEAQSAKNREFIQSLILTFAAEFMESRRSTRERTENARSATVENGFSN